MWTSTARMGLLNAAIGDGTQPSLYVALTVNNPDPGAGTPAELTVSGYGRVQVGAFVADSAAKRFYNPSDLAVGPFNAAGSYRGLILVDGLTSPLDGNHIWFADDALSSIPFNAGDSIVFSGQTLRLDCA